MKIERAEPFKIKVALGWKDWERLDQGETIGDRYDGDNKLIIHRIYPCDPYNPESKSKSLRQREYAKMDRVTMDIEIYIPHGVLRDNRISASNFDKKLGNLEVNPESHGEPWDSMYIKVSYPGSFKAIDICSYWESALDAKAE